MKSSAKKSASETGANRQDVDVDTPPRLLNRDLSWLEFNRRVLALAEDESLPLLERVRFLAIFSQNLDEFFQVRVALLRARSESGIDAATPDGLTADETRAAVRGRVLELVSQERQVFEKALLPAMAQEGIQIVSWDDLDKRDRKRMSRMFEETLFPALTPLAVDPAHPFPYVSNLSFNLGVLVRHPKAGTVRFARIKVPPLLGRFVPLPDWDRFLPIEQLIAAHLPALFPGMQIESHFPFRVTRDAELALEEEEAEDLMVEIESGLHRRHRHSDAVRLEVDDSITEHARELLAQELEISEADVYSRKGLLDLSSLFELVELDRPDLKYERWLPRTDPRLAPVDSEPPDFFEILRQGDLLVHHPYDSFDTSVEAFLGQAAADPHVLAIKHTVYRTAGHEENPIGRTLMRAAKAGKQIVTLVELKARFDEQANIEWARTLEHAGVHVVYGLVGLKTHGKLALVVRQEGDRIRRYCHVGTGNYHPGTARVYEDIGLFSAEPEVGADLSELFNRLTGFSQQPEYRKILVAPERLRSELHALIRSEMEHDDGHIVIKCNGLSDGEMIEALYEASAAGVEVDLIVRGVCCLRPGVPGLSENIRVRSILGRYLEHSRIFRFGSAQRGHRTFIGSADWMPRNLDSRVEVVVPIDDPGIAARIDEILELPLSPECEAWELGPDGTWRTLRPPGHFSCQESLQALAADRARTERAEPGR